MRLSLLWQRRGAPTKGSLIKAWQQTTVGNGSTGADQRNVWQKGCVTRAGCVDNLKRGLQSLGAEFCSQNAFQLTLSIPRSPPCGIAESEDVHALRSNAPNPAGQGGSRTQGLGERPQAQGREPGRFGGGLWLFFSLHSGSHGALRKRFQLSRSFLGQAGGGGDSHI